MYVWTSDPFPINLVVWMYLNKTSMFATAFIVLHEPCLFCHGLLILKPCILKWGMSLPRHFETTFPMVVLYCIRYARVLWITQEPWPCKLVSSSIMDSHLEGLWILKKNDRNSLSLPLSWIFSFKPSYQFLLFRYYLFYFIETSACYFHNVIMFS